MHLLLFVFCIRFSTFLKYIVQRVSVNLLDVLQVNTIFQQVRRETLAKRATLTFLSIPADLHARLKIIWAVTWTVLAEICLPGRATGNSPLWGLCWHWYSSRRLVTRRESFVNLSFRPLACLI